MVPKNKIAVSVALSGLLFLSLDECLVIVINFNKNNTINHNFGGFSLEIQRRLNHTAIYTYIF